MAEDSPNTVTDYLPPSLGAFVSRWLPFSLLVVAGAIGVVVLLTALPGGISACQTNSGRHEPRQIFEGIILGCERLGPTAEGGGTIHWARIDLKVPGVELYVTPLDTTAVAQGWQYRLRRISEVVDSERLSVAINATLFTSVPSWRPRLPGDRARGVETMVADHVVSHLWRHTYLLWFDDWLTPSLEASKPPGVRALETAKWGIGGQEVGLWDGKVRTSNSVPDSRTAIAIDHAQKVLFLAVGENISPRLLLQKLADLGAKDGMLLDGGGSTSMAIGKGAIGDLAGTLYGGWRPVATHFGIRAKPIPAGR
jgi:hypothetical protein